MAKYTESKCRLCRREGAKLFLKGERCFKGTCAFEKRPVAPGQHGMARKKMSEYGLQLREKQKCKRIYGVLEGQFRTYYDKADRMKGITGENMLSLLERRLDNVIYRMGIGSSRAQARQLVTHAHFTVNGKKANIPSMELKVGDVIQLKEKSKDSALIKAIVDNMGSKTAPAWLTVDTDNLTATVDRLPSKEDIDIPVEEQMIVELYSK